MAGKPRPVLPPAPADRETNSHVQPDRDENVRSWSGGDAIPPSRTVPPARPRHRSTSSAARAVPASPWSHPSRAETNFGGLHSPFWKRSRETGEKDPAVPINTPLPTDNLKPCRPLMPSSSSYAGRPPTQEAARQGAAVTVCISFCFLYLRATENTGRRIASGTSLYSVLRNSEGALLSGSA